jgi:hypothetical protein
VASDTPVINTQTIVSDTSVEDTQDALAATTLNVPNTCKGARDFLPEYKDIDVLRHWIIAPIPGAPAILDHAIGVAPDLEWHPDNAAPEIKDKITQIGYTVFPMSALSDCQGPADFSALLKKASIMYIRVIENCHLRTTMPKFKDSEKNSLFCPTRFVAQADAKTVLEDVLNNQTLEDGSKAPVILIGHRWKSDISQLKKEFKLSVPKLERVVCTIESLARLAEQADIIPASDRALGERLPDFDTMLEDGFKINLAGTWRHNGAKDAVYQMKWAFIFALFPLLYPDTASGSWPSDPTIAGRTINEIWRDLARNKDNMPLFTIGHERFCFYCQPADDHDAEDCPSKASLVCSYCANAMGAQNKRYHNAASGHSSSRCVKRYNHHVRQFPDWLAGLNLSLENKRKLSQAMEVKGLELIGSVFYSEILGRVPVGNYEVADLEKDEQARLAVEDLNYSEGEDGEKDGDEDEDED